MTSLAMLSKAVHLVVALMPIVGFMLFVAGCVWAMAGHVALY